MKIKRVHIEIRSLDEALREAEGVYEQLQGGKTVRPKSAIYFHSIKEMRRALTEKRLEILKTVKDRHPSSIYELSKMLGRDLKNILQDVEYLRELGVLEVTLEGDKKVPHVKYDKLAFEFAL